MSGSNYNGEMMAKGKNGEKIILEFLRRMRGVKFVEILTEYKDWQSMEVDFAVEYYTGSWWLVEAKTDYNLGESGNVLFEIMRINHTSPPEHAAQLGWGCRTKADAVLFYAPAVKKIYEFDTEVLRKGFQCYTKKTRKQMRIVIVETDDIKTTINVLIPESYCQPTVIHELPERGDHD